MLKFNDQGLIPVVVQDYQTRQVLMVAYMNQEAYEMTLETGRMHYYSRSRQALWMKGETSGHTQEMKRLSLDCDGDTLLAEVNQVGPACHTGRETCFFNVLSGNRPQGIIDSLIETIDHRYANPVQGSYTNYLFDQGLEKILKKVGEEATEVVIAAMAGKGDEMVYELSDLLYHCLVLMRHEGISLSEIYRELEKRQG